MVSLIVYRLSGTENIISFNNLKIGFMLSDFDLIIKYKKIIASE